MPELPDLNVFSSNLDGALRNKKLMAVAIAPSKDLNVSVAALKKAIEGQTVKSVYRDGKELRIAFKNDEVLGMHLMLHGSLHLSEPEQKVNHPIAELLFDNNKTLTLADWQGAANVKLNPVAKGAPDALAKEMTFQYLKDLLQSKGAIKGLLLNQDKIRGIGNAYADEILWEARISPLSISNKIPEKAVHALHKAIRKVLVDAEKQIRKSHPDIITVEVRDFLAIHNPKKKESPTGYKIENKKIGGRPTYYTEEQELYQ